tara:strand:+ start:2480 stop:2668 length:189 start_codon:yes stop_codon:yes gene_type:complete
MKIILPLFFIVILSSCGYPDIDNVPDFKDVILTDEEITDYCTNIISDKKNLLKCINDYKGKN